MKRYITLLLIFSFFPVKQSKAQSVNKQRDIIYSYAAYNFWANDQMVQWLKTATVAQLNQEVESSFNTLMKTIIHLWNAEKGWLNTIKQESWGESALESFIGNDHDKLTGFLLLSKSFTDYINQLEVDQLYEEVPVGENLMTSIADIVLHVFNHATFHRGQLITIGRQVGLNKPPRTDYIYYNRLTKDN